MGIVKRFILALVCLIIISILTWIFPFSYISVYKSSNYTADSFEVDAYSKKLNEFKESFDENSTDDVTTKFTLAILPMFEGTWLVNKGTVKMSYDELDSIFHTVSHTKNNLQTLGLEETYTEEQRLYLVDIIDNLDSLEETIESIMNEKWETRSTLNIEFRNLHNAFFNSFNVFISFYEISQQS